MKSYLVHFCERWVVYPKQQAILSAVLARWTRSSSWSAPRSTYPSPTPQFTVSPKSQTEAVANALLLPKKNNTVRWAMLWSHHQAAVQESPHFWNYRSHLWSLQMSALVCLAKDGPLANHAVTEEARGPRRRAQADETLPQRLAELALLFKSPGLQLPNSVLGLKSKNWTRCLYKVIFTSVLTRASWGPFSAHSNCGSL